MTRGVPRAGFRKTRRWCEENGVQFGRAKTEFSENRTREQYDSAAYGASTESGPESGSKSNELVCHKLALRHDQEVSLSIPRNLTDKELERIITWARLLPVFKEHQ
jgi:hypothetical protein